MYCFLNFEMWIASISRLFTFFIECIHEICYTMDYSFLSKNMEISFLYVCNYLFIYNLFTLNDCLMHIQILHLFGWKLWNNFSRTIRLSQRNQWVLYTCIWNNQGNQLFSINQAKSFPQWPIFYFKQERRKWDIWNWDSENWTVYCIWLYFLHETLLQ